jgi:hypothetical protein
MLHLFVAGNLLFQSPVKETSVPATEESAGPSNEIKPVTGPSTAAVDEKYQPRVHVNEAVAGSNDSDSDYSDKIEEDESDASDAAGNEISDWLDEEDDQRTASYGTGMATAVILPFYIYICAW